MWLYIQRVCVHENRGVHPCIYKLIYEQPLTIFYLYPSNFNLSNSATNGTCNTVELLSGKAFAVLNYTRMDIDKSHQSDEQILHLQSQAMISEHWDATQNSVIPETYRLSQLQRGYSDGTQQNIKPFILLMNLWQKKNTSGKKAYLCDSYWLVVVSTVKIITWAKRPHLTGWKMFWILHGARWQGQPQAQVAKRVTVPAGMKNHQGFVSPAPHVVRNHHPRKTKMNSEGAVPGSSKGSVPGPCKLMVKERTHWPLKVARTGWHGPLGLHSTGQRAKERRGSLLGPRPWQASGLPDRGGGGEVGWNSGEPWRTGSRWARLHSCGSERVQNSHTAKDTQSITRWKPIQSSISGLSLFWFERIYKAGCRHSTSLWTPPQWTQTSRRQTDSGSFKKKHSL